MMTVPLVQATEAEPMRGVIARLAEVERSAALWCASIAMGFAYADVLELGASVLAYGDSERQTRAAVDTLAEAMWERRDRFLPDLVPVEAAVAEATAAQEHRSSWSMRQTTSAAERRAMAPWCSTLVRAGARGAVVVVADPEAVAGVEAAGEGGMFDGLVGGKTDDRHGSPVRMRGRVERIIDGHYTHQGSYMTGAVTNMGRTAVVDVDQLGGLLERREHLARTAQTAITRMSISLCSTLRSQRGSSSASNWAMSSRTMALPPWGGETLTPSSCRPIDPAVLVR